MNAETPPTPETGHPTSESGKRKMGCSGCLLIFLGFLLFAYVLVFHTSIPLKLIASSIESNTIIDGRRLEINGVGGSLSRGIKIRELIIPGKYGDSTITDLKFRYEKPMRWFTRGQFTITEVSTSSAEFVVASDFFTIEGEVEVDDRKVGTSGEDEAPEDWFFDLHLMKFQNTRIRTADNSIDFRIPLIHMKGLHIDHDSFEVEEFGVDSDSLAVSLANGGGAGVDGQKFDIRIKPPIHKSIIREIPMTMEFRKENGRTLTRTTALDGAFQQIGMRKDYTVTRFESLSLTDFARFEDQVIPEKLNLVIHMEGDQIRIEPGNFTIGQTKFNTEAMQFEETEDPPITGKATAGPYQVTAVIHSEESSNAWPPFHVELTSEPEAPRSEVLAQLYYGRDHASLSEQEKAAINKLK